MTTSEAVPCRGGAGGGGRALRSQHGSKGALLFSGGREGRERQEGRGRAGASRDGGAGGHDCGGERQRRSGLKSPGATGGLKPGWLDQRLSPPYHLKTSQPTNQQQERNRNYTSYQSTPVHHPALPHMSPCGETRKENSSWTGQV